MSLVYCYGVVEGSPTVEKKGFEEQKVYTISFKDISAVLSDVSEKKFSQETIDKNVKDMKWLAEKGQIHETVVDSVMRITTIMPMKFCTIFKTREKVESMLEEDYADFKYNLGHLKEKVEMGIKVYFDSEPLKQKILEEDEEIKKLEEEAEKKTPGVAYFEKQKTDTLLKAKIQQKLADDVKNIFDKIKILAEEAKQNELLKRKVTGKDMLLNAVFLIKKSNLDQFKKDVEKIKSNYQHLEFQIWGPFPPYNFVK